MAYKLIPGESYNIQNGRAQTLEDLWINNTKYIGPEGQNLLKFQMLDGSSIYIDERDLLPYNKTITKMCYQFIGRHHKTI
jgi:hypothetical protein